MSKPPKDAEPPYPEWPNPDPRKPKERNEKGHFKKGTSGNYGGRPPKMVLPATKREQHRTTIAEAERIVELGGEKLTVRQVIYRKIGHDAMSGNAKAQDRFLKLESEAIQATSSYNAEANERLEFLEDYVNKVGPGPNNVMLKMLNEARAKAKKI